MELFSERVKKVVQSIPKGKTMSYQEVAKTIGNPNAARAVANVMSKNYDETIPCHRVIRNNGSAGGYNRGGQEVKKQLLESEGVVL